MPIQAPTNEDIARLLEQMADLLEQQKANPYRVEAFRRGAKSVRGVKTPLAEMVEKEGGQALTGIEGIGQGLGTTIFEILQTGRSAYLQRLLARQSPQKLLQRVPGIGPRLAGRIVRWLGVSSLEELALAARDGRLEQVPGFGPRRVAALRHNLAGMVAGPAGPPPPDQAAPAGQAPPEVGLLLEVDAEYRRRAGAGELVRLTPQRFNPQQEAWLPVMRLERAGWAMTVLFSNTARAHRWGKTRDWVVIYYQRAGRPEAECTVVTAEAGPLAGKRVIRGREDECRRFYNLAK